MLKLSNLFDLSVKLAISPNLSPKLAQNILNLENSNIEQFEYFDSEPNNTEISDLSLYALAASSYIDSLN